MIRVSALLFSAVFAAIVPLSVLAHASGVSYQSDVNGYAVDVGYSNPAPTEGESVIFDFRLKKAGPAGDDVPFTDVWVKIENTDSKNVVFASGVHNAQFGGSRMSYVFPGVGNYTISVRYENEDKTIVESAFPLSIILANSPRNGPISTEILYGLIGLVVGGAGAYAFSQKGFLKKSL